MNTITYFTAPWCSPCKKLLPRVQEYINILNGQNTGYEYELKVINIDDDQHMLASSLKIASVPALQLNSGDIIYPANMAWESVKRAIKKG